MGATGWIVPAIAPRTSKTFGAADSEQGTADLKDAAVALTSMVRFMRGTRRVWKEMSRAWMEVIWDQELGSMTLEWKIIEDHAKTGILSAKLHVRERQHPATTPVSTSHHIQTLQTQTMRP